MRVPFFIAALSLATITCPIKRTLAFQAHSAETPLQGGPQKCTLRIHVDGLRNSMGVVGSVIFASPDGWPEDTSKSVHSWPTEIPQDKREATATWDLPPGEYGVAVIHDENRNQKLDRNFLGIPKEGFGFANNPHVGLSAAPFRAAIVHVTCPVTEINVHLIYK
jgi:uncharacterized protein (DUF2141 family)